MFKNRSLVGWLLFTLCIFGATLGVYAEGTADADLKAIVDNSTALFAVVKVLGLSCLAFYVGYRLIRKLKV